jgi:hypothetical protein
MRTRLLAVALTLAGVLAVGDRAQAQVIYYETPVYYHSPWNPLVRTYSTPVAYSTYVSPIIVPTRFTYPYWGQVTYGTVPPAGATTTTTTTPTTPATTTGTVTTPTATVTDASYTKPADAKEKSSAGTAVQAVAYRPPAPAWVQVGHTTYTAAAVPIGSVYYSGDAYIPPSRYYYSPYGTPVSSTVPTSGQYSMYAGYSTPYFSTSFAQGYGGWGNGRGWAGWGRGWGWGS